jgi:hypothetical protein
MKTVKELHDYFLNKQVETEKHVDILFSVITELKNEINVILKGILLMGLIFIIDLLGYIFINDVNFLISLCISGVSFISFTICLFNKKNRLKINTNNLKNKTDLLLLYENSIVKCKNVLN